MYLAYEALPASFNVLVLLGLVALTAIRQTQRWRAQGKLARLIAEMRKAYDVLAAGTFSWQVLWSELNRTRELGAVWPGELYRLVEIKLYAGAASPHALRSESPA